MFYPGEAWHNVDKEQGSTWSTYSFSCLVFLVTMVHVVFGLVVQYVFRYLIYCMVIFVCFFSSSDGLRRRRALRQRQQRLLERRPRQRKPSPLSTNRRGRRQPDHASRRRTGHGAGARAVRRAGATETQGEQGVIQQDTWTTPRQTAGVDRVFPPSELGEGGLQVSVAELWEGADVSGGNQTSHPDNTPVVRLTFSSSGSI